MTRSRLAIAVGLACLLGGCAQPASPEPLGQVEGEVKLDDQLLPEVTVTFLAEPVKGKTRASEAKSLTDAQGKYVLPSLVEGPEGAAGGVPVGWYRVIVEDTMAENSRKGMAPRFASRYTSASKTPFRYQVTAGHQKINLSLEKEPAAEPPPDNPDKADAKAKKEKAEKAERAKNDKAKHKAASDPARPAPGLTTTQP
ncbi:MAG: hypothetical protein L0Y71_04900 [Gemmataceae bacterium]|nr:hypothetical protein [Gemmataceae bacterium]